MSRSQQQIRSLRTFDGDRRHPKPSTSHPRPVSQPPRGICEHLGHHILSHLIHVTEHVYIKVVPVDLLRQERSIFQSPDSIRELRQICSSTQTKTVVESLLVRIDPSPSSHLVATAEIPHLPRLPSKINTLATFVLAF
jgi:hypothetical protein